MSFRELTDRKRAAVTLPLLGLVKCHSGSKQSWTSRPTRRVRLLRNSSSLKIDELLITPKQFSSYPSGCFGRSSLACVRNLSSVASSPSRFSSWPLQSLVLWLLRKRARMTIPGCIRGLRSKWLLVGLFPSNPSLSGRLQSQRPPFTDSLRQL